MDGFDLRSTKHEQIQNSTRRSTNNDEEEQFATRMTYLCSIVPTFSSLKCVADRRVSKASSLVSPGALHSSLVSRFVKTTIDICSLQDTKVQAERLLGVARNRASS
jgi:hypothetical protein